MSLCIVEHAVLLQEEFAVDDVFLQTGSFVADILHVGCHFAWLHVQCETTFVGTCRQVDSVVIE